MNFTDDILQYINNDLGLTVEDIKNMSLNELKELKVTVKLKHEYEDLMNLSTKLLGNSLYGASGNAYFYFFNPNLSATITAEGRGTIHYMERYLTNFLCNVFPYDKELAKRFGIEFKSKEEIENSSYVKNQEALIYGDTDSLYINYGGLFTLMTDETVPKTDDDKLNWIINFNQQYLDAHNKEVLRKWIDEERHGKSIHNFELETVSISTINLAKKKYICALKWKDGKTFETPKIKPKGIEIIQSSTPQFCRKYLKELSEMLLLKNIDELKTQFNIEVGKVKEKFMQAPIENISCSINVGEYNKYVIDINGIAPEFEKRIPVSVQAAGWYNWAVKQLKKEASCKMIGSGDKIKFYVTGGRQNKTGKMINQKYFGYPAGDFPDWADNYMPINRAAQFEKTFLSPINRIAEVVGLPKATRDGGIVMTLF